MLPPQRSNFDGGNVRKYRLLFGYTQQELLRTICTDRQLSLPIMKMYRDQLPWDLLADQASKGWLTAAKMKEFKKELEQYGI